MGVGVVVQQVVAHRIDDRGGDLRAARAIEVRDRIAMVAPGQRGKLRADRVEDGQWMTTG